MLQALWPPWLLIAGPRLAGLQTSLRSPDTMEVPWEPKRGEESCGVRKGSDTHPLVPLPPKDLLSSSPSSSNIFAACLLLLNGEDAHLYCWLCWPNAEELLVLGLCRLSASLIALSLRSKPLIFLPDIPALLVPLRALLN